MTFISYLWTDHDNIQTHNFLAVYTLSKKLRLVKRLPAMQETWVRSLGWEDPLEKEMAIHSSILAWRIPWTEEPGGYSPWSCKESDTTEQWTHTQKVEGWRCGSGTDLKKGKSRKQESTRRLGWNKNTRQSVACSLMIRKIQTICELYSTRELRSQCHQAAKNREHKGTSRHTNSWGLRRNVKKTQNSKW